MSTKRHSPPILAVFAALSGASLALADTEVTAVRET
jgi:hypothetical protein